MYPLALKYLRHEVGVGDLSEVCTFLTPPEYRMLGCALITYFPRYIETYFKVLVWGVHI